AFGVAFEVHVATIIFVKLGITTPEDLETKRPYIIIIAFVVGMLMTPPDIFSQTLLAVPVWLLFELGLFTSRYIARKDAEKAAREEAELAEEEELPDP
ncbi:MAG: Sec-independent protein translocase subunit TatC, partial [Gammaproteobacteria bacterium]|nr:Sec-independent protein translocase subunit TatC [Gammaproteobacteria bacterium]